MQLYSILLNSSELWLIQAQLPSDNFSHWLMKICLRTNACVPPSTHQITISMGSCTESLGTSTVVTLFIEAQLCYLFQTKYENRYPVQDQKQYTFSLCLFVSPFHCFIISLYALPLKIKFPQCQHKIMTFSRHYTILNGNSFIITVTEI